MFVSLKPENVDANFRCIKIYSPFDPKDSSKFKILLLKIFSLTQNTSEILAATMDGG